VLALLFQFKALEFVTCMFFGLLFSFAFHVLLGADYSKDCNVGQPADTRSAAGQGRNTAANSLLTAMATYCGFAI
jgi:hypothetical protein